MGGNNDIRNKTEWIFFELFERLFIDGFIAMAMPSATGIPAEEIFSEVSLRLISKTIATRCRILNLDFETASSEIATHFGVRN